MGRLEHPEKKWLQGETNKKYSCIIEWHQYQGWRGTVVERRSLAGVLSLDLQLMGDH